MSNFCQVSETDLPYHLEKISPQGNTAMRDSILLGVMSILRANQQLQKQGCANQVDFVHIVITDGEDTASSASLEDTMGMMLTVGLTIPKERCKTVIIGIDLGSNREAKQQLYTMRALGLDTCEIYDVDSVDLSQIFDRIQISIGIRERTEIAGVQAGGMTALAMRQRRDPFLMLRAKKFAVLFNLDISGSMEGRRWTRVKQCVERFMHSMAPTDLIGAICFNDKPLSYKEASSLYGGYISSDPSLSDSSDSDW
mmetsp:Transcript_10567/g.20347  ORF Transcript_10567/g.20347 Transcript_10567/m.20347 type:complete len:254 (+) Transcript_10567:1241-2002(+)